MDMAAKAATGLLKKEAKPEAAVLIERQSDQKSNIEIDKSFLNQVFAVVATIMIAASAYAYMIWALSTFKAISNKWFAFSSQFLWLRFEAN